MTKGVQGIENLPPELLRHQRAETTRGDVPKHPDSVPLYSLQLVTRIFGIRDVLSSSHLLKIDPRKRNFGDLQTGKGIGNNIVRPLDMA